MADIIPVAAGVAVFAWWLLNTSLGRTSLVQSKPRRNRMGFLVPFAVFFVWLLTGGLLSEIFKPLARRLDESEASFLIGTLGALGSLVVIALILFVARMAFARGLKGLGLNVRTVPRDLGRAFMTLLAVWPLVAAAMSLTTLVMKVLDENFEIPQHEALRVITHSNSASLQTLMIVLAVAIAPLIEELLFRGLFQTMIRSYVGRPWPAIVIASILFAVIHRDAEHWPALFVLALGLGYSYEKSGSLLRPIFMHAMFNGLSILSALGESPAA